MRPTFVVGLALLAGMVLVAAIHASTGPIPLNCNRACLENLADQSYPFTNDCRRIENGTLTAGAPARGNQAPGAIDAFAMDCMTQFKLGYYFVVQSIHGRRYPVVDQERGVVWAHGVIDQGTVNSGVLSDGRPYTFNGFNRPSSILFTEAFLIEQGKIRRVEMVGPSATFHINSPWPGGLSGN